MKELEDFKNEVEKMVDIYNRQEHWVDGEIGGLIITIKPIFGDFSSDGYMPKFCANFLVFWGGKYNFKSNSYIEYNIRFERYISGFKNLPPSKAYKSIRASFKKNFNI